MYIYIYIYIYMYISDLMGAASMGGLSSGIFLTRATAGDRVSLYGGTLLSIYNVFRIYLSIHLLCITIMFCIYTIYHLFFVCISLYIHTNVSLCSWLLYLLCVSLYGGTLLSSLLASLPSQISADAVLLYV